METNRLKRIKAQNTGIKLYQHNNKRERQQLEETYSAVQESVAIFVIKTKSN